MFILTNELLFQFKWIDYNKLNILGISETWINYIVFMLAFLLLFASIQPLITWITYRQKMLLLTYVISSLLFMISSLFIVFWTNIVHGIKDDHIEIAVKVEIIQHALIIVGIFGFILASVHYIKYIFVHIKN